MRSSMKMLAMDAMRKGGSQNNKNSQNNSPQNNGAYNAQNNDSYGAQGNGAYNAYNERRGGNRMEMGNASYNGYDMAENRFRDRTGREHYDNGRFAPSRNAYDGNQGEYDGPMDTYGEGARNEMRPYLLPRRQMSQIGFDSREGGEHQRGHSESMSQKLGKDTAMEWARQMENEDGSNGPHWTMEQTRQLAGNGVDPVEFFAVMNAMYSDYCKVLKKFGIDRPEVYAELAKAWIDDKDAVPNKAAAYYEYIVKH